jgi:hypothetical protein
MLATPLELVEDHRTERRLPGATARAAAGRRRLPPGLGEVEGLDLSFVTLRRRLAGDPVDGDEDLRRRRRIFCERVRDVEKTSNQDESEGSCHARIDPSLAGRCGSERYRSR